MVTRGPTLALATGAVILLLIAGCGGPQARQAARPAGGTVAQVVPARHRLPTIFQLAQGLAAQLRSNMREGSLGERSCVVTTLVDIDDLHRSTRFGRLISEALAGELFRMGADVRDVKLSFTITVAPRTGELALSRDIREVASRVSADSVVAGTYAVGRSTVAVVVKLLDARDNRVLSVAEAEIARTPTIDALLDQQSRLAPTAMDRLPSR